VKKSSFTLIEVIIAVTLLSIVIVSVLKIKENNFSNISKLNTINQDLQLLSIVSIDPNYDDSLNKHFYLDKVLSVKDDNLRKKLKNTKVYIKSQEEDYQELDSFALKIIKTKYTIENKASNSIYTFKIKTNQ
jgi:hypothetical protein